MLSFGLGKGRGRGRMRGRGGPVGLGKRPRLAFEEAREEEQMPRAEVDAPEVEGGDEFDAFMADIEKKVAQPAGTASGPSTPRPSDQIDEEIDRHDLATAIQANSTSDHLLENYDHDNNTRTQQQDTQGFVLPLDPVDHSTRQYIQIRKVLWVGDPHLTHMTIEEVEERRAHRRLTVTPSGDDVGPVPPPIVSFGEAGTSLGSKLLHAVNVAGYTSPTDIQAQAIPAALNGHDLVAIAKTGSGKTAAFVLPMLVSILDQPFVHQGEGPIGLIIAPTRELALQIGSEARKFASQVRIKVSVIVGGQPKFEQYKELRDGGAECVVATPGRMIDLIKMKACGLSRVSYLVLDEADRMFDLGFEAQIRSLLGQIRPDRQTLFFSATFESRVERLANHACGVKPLRIVVGEAGQPNEDIEQKFHTFPSVRSKTNWLQSWLRANPRESVVVFATTKASCAELANSLRSSGLATASIHGETQQEDREGMMRMFRKREVSILVATDIAARGLDIKGVGTVVNYEVPTNLDWYTHRIGRTGRAGSKGVAHTLLVSGNSKDSQFVHSLLEKTGPEFAPAALSEMAKTTKLQQTKRDIKRTKY